MSGNVSREEYEAFIYGDGYDVTLAQSLAWTSDISLFFHNTIEGKASHPEGNMGSKEVF